MTLPADPSPWVGEFPGLAPWPGVDDFQSESNDFKPAMAFTAPAPTPFNSSQKEAVVAEGYKLTVSLKGKTQSDPWTVVNANTPKELHELLEGIHAEGIYTAVGRAQSAYQTGLLMGSKLGATTVSVEKAEEEPGKEPAKPAAKKPATRKPATAKKAESEEAPKAEAEEASEDSVETAVDAQVDEATKAEEPKPAKVARPTPGSGAPKPRWAK